MWLEPRDASCSLSSQLLPHAGGHQIIQTLVLTTQHNIVPNNKLKIHLTLVL